MKICRFWPILALASILSAAELPPETRDWHRYIAAGTSNAEMKIRASEATAILDRRMRELIAEAAGTLDAAAVALLDESQKAWQEHAKAKGRFLADAYRGGSHEGLAFGHALIDEQIRRIRELQAMRRAHETP